MFAAIAKATVLDWVRRPGFIVGVCVLGVALGVLPRLANPAAGVADNVSLAVELTLSTLGLVGPAVAGGLCVIGLQRDCGEGMSPELTATQLGTMEILFGRWLGAVCVAGCLVVGGLALGSLGWIGTPGHLPPVTSVGAVAVAASLISGWAVGGAIGALWGGLARRELALLLVLLHIVAARLLGSVAHSGGLAEAAAFLLPDPGRLDVSRELSFARAISGWAVVTGLVASGLSTAGLLALAMPACRRKAATV